MSSALGYHGGSTVIGREYFVRQAATLFKFAKITNDPKISVALLEKAADLKAQVDETIPAVDPSPQAPDVEPPAQSSAWRPQMTPQVFIRRDTASEFCDVVVSVRGQEIILRCPNYSQALKWARLECKSYKIPEPEIEPLISEPEVESLGGLDHDEELPLFLRSPETAES
jgi:hypothetical protein